ncbi:hypothetical protein ACVWYJ_002347 [Bradyrhizobium sp. USDA 4471]
MGIVQFLLALELHLRHGANHCCCVDAPAADALDGHLQVGDRGASWDRLLFWLLNNRRATLDVSATTELIPFRLHARTSGQRVFTFAADGSALVSARGSCPDRAGLVPASRGALPLLRFRRHGPDHGARRAADRGRLAARPDLAPHGRHVSARLLDAATGLSRGAAAPARLRGAAGLDEILCSASPS